jgi:uncharacterized protein (DUF169 family)
MGHAALASSLQQHLGLELAPIALARATTPPTGVERLSERVPSACALWRRAEKGVFYADLGAHLGCPIGAMVMGFELPEASRTELFGLVRAMCELDYIEEQEVSHIPKLSEHDGGIVYGPLELFPIDPEFVLIWTSPAQAMLLQEATGVAVWSETSSSSAFGRPACGALPIAASRGISVLSLGCIGMRTFTEIADGRCLAALPARTLVGLESKLDKVAHVNQKMRAFYEGRK